MEEDCEGRERESSKDGVPGPALSDFLYQT